MFVLGILSLLFISSITNRENYSYITNEKYKETDICIYIFLWKKISQNALKLYDNLSKTFNDIIIIDCDETNTIDIQNIIKLDDSAYYGKQFDTAIKHAKNNKIIGIFVGDIDPIKINCKQIKENLLYSMNNKNAGIYSPNDVRSDDKAPVHFNLKNKTFNLGKIDDTDFFRTSYTDCTSWFFIPELITIMKTIDFSKSNLGWGIDLSLIKLAINNGYNVIKDYSVNIYNPPGTNYKSDKALKEMNSFYEYLSTIDLFKNINLSQRNVTIKPKIHLIFFGDKKLDNTKNSLLKESSELNFFDTITPYDENIFNDKPELKLFVENNRRGYGYWVWKPLICLKKMEEIEHNDIIFYCDVGYTVENKEKLLEYCEYAIQNDLIGFKLRYKEKEYTKNDLFEYLNANDLKDINQIMSGVFIFKKTPKNINFFEDWFNISKADNFHYIDDTPSKTKNDKSFKEHRHDQSIFSILINKCTLKKIIDNEIDINEPDFKKSAFTVKRLK